METSPRHNLPYIMPSQAQKHVTHNEAVRMIDGLIQTSVLDRDLTSPPANPEDGDLYVIASPASGEWSGMDDQLAAFQDDVWMFFAPQNGHLVWVSDEETLLVRHENNWQTISMSELETLGINTSADASNRLAVSSDAILFTHASSDHRLKINKSSQTDTASLLFQTGFSGRAEIGTTGDDALHIKTSGDGTQWSEALVIDGSSGSVQFPATPALNGIPIFNLFEDAGRFAGSPEPNGVSAPSFVQPGYFSPYNGATLTAGPKFIHNNNNFGGTAGTMTADIEALTQTTRPGAQPATLRYGPEYFSMQLQAGTGASFVSGGTTHYLALGNSANILPQKSVLNLWFLVQNGSAAIRDLGGDEYFINGVQHQPQQAFAASNLWQQFTRRLTQPIDTYLGYVTPLAPIYLAPGSTILIALPFLYPGHLEISTDTIFSTVPSLRTWR